MNLFGWEISRAGHPEQKAISLNTLIARLDDLAKTSSGAAVTPDNCMRSPTVHAIVTGASRRIASLPAQVMAKTTVDGQTQKTRMPDHPVQKLLDRPNGWQSSTDYWHDAVSTFIRYGNFYAHKAGPRGKGVRELLPLDAGATCPEQAADWSVTFKTTLQSGQHIEYPQSEIHHVRGGARNFVKGDSPIMDCREAIGLEIAAESFGASFFGNGAQPGLVFQFIKGVLGFKTDEERNLFIEKFQEIYAGKGRHRAFMLPHGMEIGAQIAVDNDKAQFLETRKLQRNIIAGALGFPPHLVGDLERATFSNIEHQSLESVRDFIRPIAQTFEKAMERDLLTEADRKAGIIIRFNFDAVLRADFKTRQEGLAIQRQNGVISADEWREHEGMNPRADGGGGTYYEQGPSGQTPAGGNEQNADQNA